MSLRQIEAYYYFASVNKRQDLGLQLNINALAAQGGGEIIKKESDRLLNG